MTTINALANDAVVAFAKLAGLKAGNWFDRETVDDLNESRELDPSGVTTLMMLRGYLDKFAEATTFSARTVIQDPTAFIARVEAVRSVYELLDRPDAVAAVSDFMQRAARVFERCSVKKDWTTDPGEVGFIRRDAYRSMAKLEPHQFTRGAPESAKLAVNQSLFEFWNINSLLVALQHQRLPGVSLCLMRDPDEVMASYFVFAIRNGDNITILTDREDVAHPLYWQMSRRPDRQLEKRAKRHWFPYQLLDLKMTADMKSMYAETRTALVPYQLKLAPLCALSDLPPGQYLWTHMVLELLAEEYGTKNKQLPQLSYTGEMVVHPNALVSPGSALARQGHTTLALARQTMGNVTARSTRRQWERKPTAVNEWMIARYADQVPDEALNVVGPQQAKLVAKTVGRSVIADVKNDRHMITALKLEGLMPTNFGTADHIARDLQWTARVNQTRVVQQLAEAEYIRREKELHAWFQDRLKERLPMLVDMAARGDAIPEPWRDAGMAEKGAVKRRNMIHQLVRPINRKAMHDWEQRSYGAVKLGRYDRRCKLEWRCAVTDMEASVFTFFNPKTAAGLAYLVGCKVTDLPDVLRHWLHRDIEPYSGNSILDRIDPSDWVLSSPWNAKMRFEVQLSLSWRTFTAARKRLGVPLDKAPDTRPMDQVPIVIRWGDRWAKR